MKKLLNIYCTAGYPNNNDTVEVMQLIQDAGADIIELGMPYSDPVADGPVIEAAGKISLENGMSIPVLLEQLKEMRSKVTIPVYLMGYLNPIMQFGVEAFIEKSVAAGVTGLIIPDLPPDIFEKEYQSLFEKHGLHFVCLVTPETSDERIKYLDNISSGFLYAVSSSSTTGKNKSLTGQQQYFERLQSLKLKNKILVGFGIRSKENFDFVCGYADGAIIGTAFIETISQSGNNWKKNASAFIKSITKSA